MRLDWFRARRAHEQLAVADVEGEAAASDLAIAVADLRRAALGEAPPDNRPLELSREPDADFLARHDVLAERAKSLPWAEWDQSAKEEMAAFLADLEVDDVSGPVATPGASDDAARLAAFPEFDPALRVRAASDPADVSRTLARHGLYSLLRGYFLLTNRGGRPPATTAPPPPPEMTQGFSTRPREYPRGTPRRGRDPPSTTAPPSPAAATTRIFRRVDADSRS